jgi:hypothetical protein
MAFSFSIEEVALRLALWCGWQGRLRHLLTDRSGASSRATAAALPRMKPGREVDVPRCRSAERIQSNPREKNQSSQRFAYPNRDNRENRQNSMQLGKL